MEYSQQRVLLNVHASVLKHLDHQRVLLQIHHHPNVSCQVSQLVSFSRVMKMFVVVNLSKHCTSLCMKPRTSPRNPRHLVLFQLLRLPRIHPRPNKHTAVVMNVHNLYGILKSVTHLIQLSVILVAVGLLISRLGKEVRYPYPRRVHSYPKNIHQPVDQCVTLRHVARRIVQLLQL